MAQEIQSSIRPARPDEVEALTSLTLRSKAYWGYDEAFMAACREELTITPNYLEANPTFVLEDAGRAVGLYTLESMEKDEDVELGMLFIDPDEIGSGHGGQLFAHARGKAAALGYRTMWIQSDPDAEGFYRSQGAVTMGHKESRSLPGRMLPWMRIEALENVSKPRSRTAQSSNSTS